MIINQIDKKDFYAIQMICATLNMTSTGNEVLSFSVRGNPGTSGQQVISTEFYKEYNIRITSSFIRPVDSSKEKVTKLRMEFVPIKFEQML